MISSTANKAEYSTDEEDGEYRDVFPVGGRMRSDVRRIKGSDEEYEQNSTS